MQFQLCILLVSANLWEEKKETLKCEGNQKKIARLPDYVGKKHHNSQPGKVIKQEKIRAPGIQ